MHTRSNGPSAILSYLKGNVALPASARKSHLTQRGKTTGAVCLAIKSMSFDVKHDVNISRKSQTGRTDKEGIWL